MQEAEDMYLRALAGLKKACGAEYTSTLKIINNLGALYKDQGKMQEAKDMYLRVLVGKEKTWSAEHKETLNTVNNLGILYMISRQDEGSGKQVSASTGRMRQGLGC